MAASLRLGAVYDLEEKIVVASLLTVNSSQVILVYLCNIHVTITFIDKHRMILFLTLPVHAYQNAIV
jgi:hypothetical protein